MSIWDNISIFGESRGKLVGACFKNLPAGIKIDMENVNEMLKRRQTGINEWVSARKETDIPEIVSGYYNGYTTGEPLCVFFKNEDVDKQENEYAKCPRPSHADYTSNIASGGYADTRGGGYNSGRLTSPMVFLGAIAKQILSERDIFVLAKLKNIAYIHDEAINKSMPDIDAIISCQYNEIPMINEESRNNAIDLIKKAKQQNDSLSSTVECIIIGIPAGIGGLMFENAESILSQGLFAIPGLKALQFGENPTSLIYGSEYNDEFIIKDGEIITSSNNCGGILGGRSNGMPIYFNCSFKPTPSIAIEQKTINTDTMTAVNISCKGRNDACIGIRATVVVEAIAAIYAMYSVLELK